MDSQRTLIPLKSTWILNNLHRLLETLQSSVRSKGNSKILVTSGGHFDVASSSSGILNRLDLNCPVCLYIIQTALKLNDFGLYFCITISHFLVSSLKKDEFQSWVLTENVKILKGKILDALNSSSVKHKWELSSQKVLLPLTKSILSKHLSHHSIDHLSVQIVKAFLLSVDDRLGKLGKSFICCEESSEDFEAFHGVLYRLDDVTSQERKLYESLNKEPICLIIITFMLVPNKERTLENLLEGLTELTKLGVRLIACQKVVDERITFFMRRKGIVVIQRMGEETTRALEYVSSAIPVGEWSDLRADNLRETLGKLSSVRLVEKGSLNYLVLESFEAPCSTLLVHDRVIGGLDELKNSVRQCMDTLRLVASSPYLVPGGGCFEGLLLINMDLKNEDAALIHVAKSFILATLQGVGHTSPVLDTTYGHVWEGRNRCSCGMISSSDLKAPNFSELAEVDFNHSYDYSPFENPNYLFDCLETKKNSILLALETIISILDIGLIIYK